MHLSSDPPASAPSPLPGTSDVYLHTYLLNDKNGVGRQSGKELPDLALFPTWLLASFVFLKLVRSPLWLIAFHTEILKISEVTCILNIPPPPNVNQF